MCHVLVHRGLPTVVDHDSTNCTIDEVFSDWALPAPPGPHLCGDPDPYRTIGRTSVVFLSPLALNDFGKWTNMAPFPFLDKLLVYVPVIKAAIMKRGFICISLIGVISGIIKLTTTGTFASRNDQRALEIEPQNVTSAKYWATTRSHLDCATTCALGSYDFPCSSSRSDLLNFDICSISSVFLVTCSSSSSCAHSQKKKKLDARRLNAKDVLTPMNGDNFTFPIEDGTVKISGEDQDLRTSTFIWDSPDRGKEQFYLRGESDGSSSTSRQDSSWWWWSQKWYWVNLRRFHLPSSRGTPSQTVRADWRINPYSTETHWRYQDYRHNFRCDVGETYWRLLERWWRERIVGCMDRFHKIHCIEWEATGWIYTVREGRLTRKQTTSRPDTVWPDVWKEAYVWCSEKERKAIMGHRETQTRKCQKITCYFLYWTWWWRTRTYNENCSWKVGKSDASRNALWTST